MTDSTIAIAETHVARRRLPRRLPTDEDVAAHRPVQVVWELTLACNLRCVHCGSRAGRKREGELSTEECLDVVRQLAELGTRQITLIGGEAYLRKDWLIIAKAITDAGIHCGIQSGARALTEERIRAAVEAGIGTLGVSIDGPRDIHDRQRGVKGSFDHALRALRFANAAGIKPGVNTQINALSKPHLREIFDTIVEHGARYWQVQITVAMGNAVDNDAMLLQPHEIPETLDLLADLFERGRQIGFRLIPGNNIGYYGPHEYMWRTITSEPEHWAGCTAGENSLGLEADGKIKSCPSLPADPYGGGNARTVSIRDAMAALVPTHDAARPHAGRRILRLLLLLERVPRRLHLGDARALRKAWRQSILLLSRARTGEEGAARAYREGRGGARRAVRFRALRHRRGRRERPARAGRTRARRQEAPARTQARALHRLPRIHLRVRTHLPALRRGASAGAQVRQGLIRARGAVAGR